MFHPWRSLRHFQHIVVEWARPHPDLVAASDGHSRIWMDPRMNQVERRCVLTHELVHIELGHRGCQPRAVERDVRAEAAYRLIRLEDLLSGSVWALGPCELADELWVTDMVLHDRLASLTAGERAQLPDDVRRYVERLTESSRRVV